MTNIGKQYKDGGLKDYEWPFHVALHGVISRVIDPDNVRSTKRWPIQYIFDGVSTWNRRPKCFEAFYKLSQPKVDSMLILPYADLRPLLGKVSNGSYHHQSRKIQCLEGILGSPEEVNELLSANVMKLLCTYEETAQASRLALYLFLLCVSRAEHCANFSQIVYCNTSKTHDRGDYVLTFWEFKKSEAELDTCINQVVNAGIFLVSRALSVHLASLSSYLGLNQCGKQVDLILYAKSIERGFKTVNPCCLGMAVTGRKWRIYLILAVAIATPKPRFVNGPFFASDPMRLAWAKVSLSCFAFRSSIQQDYVMLAEGDWIDSPKRFLGAVVTMHEIMLDHTVKLLVSCLRVIVRYVKVSFTAIERPFLLIGAEISLSV